MRSTAIGLFLLCAILAPALSQQQRGVAPEWDIRKVLEEISAHAGRLLSVLEQIDPQSWVGKGASETYVSQWNSAKLQAKALSSAARELSKQPEKLPAALEALFRMQAVESMLASLGEGIRKYQNPALADLLAGVAAENGANRVRFQQYIVDLATEKEQEFRIMDQEAQRCRGLLSRPPAPRKTERK